MADKTALTMAEIQRCLKDSRYMPFAEWFQHHLLPPPPHDPYKPRSSSNPVYTAAQITAAIHTYLHHNSGDYDAADGGSRRGSNARDEEHASITYKFGKAKKQRHPWLRHRAVPPRQPGNELEKPASRVRAFVVNHASQIRRRINLIQVV